MLTEKQKEVFAKARAARELNVNARKAEKAKKVVVEKTTKLKEKLQKLVPEPEESDGEPQVVIVKRPKKKKPIVVYESESDDEPPTPRRPASKPVPIPTPVARPRINVMFV